MSGLLLIFTLIVCVICGVFAVRFVVRRVRNPRWKTPVMLGLTVLLISAPFVDEVIGKYQFEALCKANGIESADVSRARGRRVRIHFDYEQDRSVPWQVLPTTETELRIKDEVTDDVLAQYKDYRTKGGWLMRYTPLSMGSPQSMLFGGSTCDWSATMKVMQQNEMTWIKS